MTAHDLTYCVVVRVESKSKGGRTEAREDEGTSRGPYDQPQQRNKKTRLYTNVNGAFDHVERMMVGG